MGSHIKVNEYIWLIKTVRRAGKITFADISRKWAESQLSDGTPLPRTTFYHMRQGIEKQFAISIVCDQRDGCRYYIKNQQALDSDEMCRWAQSTLQAGYELSEHMALKDMILLQDIPVSGVVLSTVLEAMQQKRKLDIVYCKYGASHPLHHHIAPYAIKNYKGRWYVLGLVSREDGGGKPSRGRLVVFAFDRIGDIVLSDEKFRRDPDFDASEYFKHSFGVYVGDEKPQHVVLRFFDHQRYYVSASPLHKSQRLVGEGDNWTDFSYYIRITNDFISELLRYGSFLKVMEPEGLVRRMLQEYSKAMAAYHLDEEKEASACC